MVSPLTTIAQITDTHILDPGGRHQFVTDTAYWLERCVAALNALAPLPHATVLTGDIADHGRATQYARARSILEELNMPYFVLGGNHDDPQRLRETFADRRGELRHEASLSWAHDGLPVRVVGLDTTLPGKSGGFLDDDRLVWLDAMLAVERPVFIFVHHPPLRTGMHYLDLFRFHGARAFGEVLARHPNVARVACGHIHYVIERPWFGTIVRTSVSSSPQYVPEFFSRRLAGLVRERPGYSLHAYDEIHGAMSATRFVDSP